jgi:hypothetical protein
MLVIPWLKLAIELQQTTDFGTRTRACACSRTWSGKRAIKGAQKLLAPLARSASRCSDSVCASVHHFVIA